MTSRGHCSTSSVLPMTHKHYSSLISPGIQFIMLYFCFSVNLHLDPRAQFAHDISVL